MIWNNPQEKPRALIPVLKNIPQELKECPQWLYWRWTWSKGRKAWTKPPYKSKKVMASVNNPKTYGEFDRVRDFAPKGFDGVGFVFTESDYFVGIDVDDCFRETDGAIDITASCILTAADTYSEASPTGLGMKLFFRLPELPSLHSNVFFVKKLKVEIYAQDRYFTVTGHVLNGFDKPLQTSIDNFKKVMEIIHEDSDHSEDKTPQFSFGGVSDVSLPAEASVDNATKSDVPPESDATESVEEKRADVMADSDAPYIENDEWLITPDNDHFPNHETIKRLLVSNHKDRFYKLWTGDLSDFDNDQNRGDLSLCWLLAKYGSPVPSDIDGLFRQSALYRAKWDRWNYRGSTMMLAIDKVLLQEREGKPVLRGEPKMEPLNESSNGEGDGNGRSSSGGDLGDYEIPSSTNLPYGDTWNAHTFNLNRQNVYYWVEDWQRFYFWNQTRWLMDGTLRVKRDFNEMVRSMASSRIAAKVDSDDALLKHLVGSLSSKSTNAALEVLKPMIAVESTIFDGNPDLLNCPNGTVDLRTGKLEEHQRAHHINQQAAVSYEYADYDGEWLDFLEQIQPDVEMRCFLQRAVGYTLTGHEKEQCLFYLFGTGKNGKTTFIEAIRNLLVDYAIRAPSQMLQMDQFKSGNDYSVPELRGKRMVVHSEVVAHKKLDEGLVKDLTGSEGLVGRRPYAREYDRFQSVSKHWLYGNHLVRIQGSDEGIWRRIRLVEFTVKIDNPNLDFIEKLKTESIQRQILSWAVFGAMEWYEQGLNPPEGVIKATESYREGQDDVKQFLDQYCEFERGGFVSSAKLWEAYHESFDGALNRRQWAQRITMLHGESSVARTTEGIRRGWGGLILNE